MCYGSDCKWEIRYGENAGECRKPPRFPCPMDEDDDNEDYKEKEITKIFVINGVGGSGKDTFVRTCNNEIPCALTSTIDNIKLMLKSAEIYVGDFTLNYGWINEIKGPKERKLLSDIKNILTNYNDFSMKSLTKNIYNLKMDGFAVIFIMVREFDEMIRIVDAHQAKTILIESNRVLICETEQSFLDQIPKDYVWDYTFSNNGNKLSFITKVKEWLQNEVLNNE